MIQRNKTIQLLVLASHAARWDGVDDVSMSTKQQMPPAVVLGGFLFALND